MFSNSVVRLLGIAALAAVLTLASNVAFVYAGLGEGPPPGSQITGFPIDAVLTATFDSNTSQTTIVIVGNCKKTAVAFGPVQVADTQSNFASQTADTINNRRLGNVGPAGCYSTNGGEDLIITGVSKFNNTGTRLGADISISVLSPK